MAQGPRITGGRTFKDCVLDCARDEKMVAAYNKLYGTHLSAPITALLEQRTGNPALLPDTPEGTEHARFIMFCYDAVWQHVSQNRQRRRWPLKLRSRPPG